MRSDYSKLRISFPSLHNRGLTKKQYYLCYSNSSPHLKSGGGENACQLSYRRLIYFELLLKLTSLWGFSIMISLIQYISSTYCLGLLAHLLLNLSSCEFTHRRVRLMKVRIWFNIAGCSSTSESTAFVQDRHLSSHYYEHLVMFIIDSSIRAVVAQSVRACRGVSVSGSLLTLCHLIHKSASFLPVIWNKQPYFSILGLKYKNKITFWWIAFL